jgi:hypothetical protein
MQAVAFAGQAFPHAPQLFRSDASSVQVPPPVGWPRALHPLQTTAVGDVQHAPLVQALFAQVVPGVCETRSGPHTSVCGDWTPRETLIHPPCSQTVSPGIALEQLGMMGWQVANVTPVRESQ